MMTLQARLWLLWFIASVSCGAGLVAAMLSEDHQWPFLIGKMTTGHHQIELACKACHLSPFGGKEALQESCVGCHGEELRQAKDSHPAKKFNDPRNADRLAKLNAQSCLSCHREHKPQLTRAMGVTVPDDFCALCHADIAQERSSHKGLSFNGCANAGCHNYHDNQALYEDFLVKHAGQPATAATPLIALSAALDVKQTVAAIRTPEPRGPLTVDMADSPDETRSPAILAEWSADIHARKGVNCSDCHRAKIEGTGEKAWVDWPGLAGCQGCHADQTRTLLDGKHGLRLRPDLRPLAPMRPSFAEKPMKASAPDKEIGCASCHGAHSFDTVKAQTEACLGCHDDSHSKAYIGSPHHKLWLDGTSGHTPTGVSCAGCHMPRVRTDDSGLPHIFTNHNQNANLRPTEKMVRSVCGECHGLQFALDTLADPTLARRNYAGQPATRVESIEWALKRREAKGDASIGTAIKERTSP
jgi:predicted CXXCH cytochrome family protein